MNNKCINFYSMLFLLIFSTTLLPLTVFAENKFQDLRTIASDRSPSKASISGNVQDSNNDQQSVTFENDDPLDIQFSIAVAPEDIGFASELYIVAKYNDKWFYKDSLDKWHEFELTTNFSKIAFAKKKLQAKENLTLASKRLLGPGEYLLYVGYLNRQDKVVYNSEPLSFIVFSADNPSLHRFRSAHALTSYFKSAYQQPVNNYFGPTFSSDIAAFSGGTEISGTNVQEAGVDEADKVKTDGQHLFAVGNCDENKKACLSAFEINESPASNTLLSQYELDEAFLNSEFYLTNTERNDEKKAMAILVDGLQEVMWLSWPFSGGWYNGAAEINMIDVTDPKNMKSLTQIKLEGHLISSRRIGNMLYLVSRTTPKIPSYIDGLPVEPENGITQQEIDNNQKLLDDFKLEDIIPTIAFDDQKPVALHQAEDCFLPAHDSDKTPDRTIISVTAIPINEPQNYQSLCVIGLTETFYASTEAIYLATSRYQYDNKNNDGLNYVINDQSGKFETEIHKINLSEQGMDYKGSGTVTGHLGWQIDKKPFRMGEYNNELRIATSLGNTWDTSSSTSLSILKESENSASLEKIGGIDDLGKPGESLFAARFIAKRGYLVTFLQTDPLYVLDLSDGTHPKIIGELEINGFSDYLHPIGDKYLLGIGKQAVTEKDQNSIERVWNQGVKISLFDVSSAQSLKEIQSMEIGQRGTYSEVLNDHHAFTYLEGDSNRPTRFAIPIVLHDSAPNNSSGAGAGDGDAPDSVTSWWDWTHSGLYVFDLNAASEPGFELSGKLIGDEATADKLYPGYHSARSVLQGDTVHYFYNNELISRAIADLE